MPKTELDGLPVIETDESEEITIAVKVDDFDEGDLSDPEQHPIAIALRRQHGIRDARVSKPRGSDPARQPMVQIRRAEAGLLKGIISDGCSDYARQSADSRTQTNRTLLIVSN
jgi:hypothetical protein